MHQTKVALEPLLQRLTPNSTIAFIQNGMGIVEELNTEVFPNPTSRPHYIMGVTTHGASSPQDPYEPFTVIRNGIGNLKLGIIHTEQAVEKAELNPSITPTEYPTPNDLLSATCHHLLLRLGSHLCLPRRTLSDASRKARSQQHHQSAHRNLPV